MKKIVTADGIKGSPVITYAYLRIEEISALALSSVGFSVITYAYLRIEDGSSSGLSHII